MISSKLSSADCFVIGFQRELIPTCGASRSANCLAITAVLIFLTCKVALTAATPINTPIPDRKERTGLPNKELQLNLIKLRIERPIMLFIEPQILVITKDVREP